MIKKFFIFILDSIQALVLALSVFVLLYLFIAQPNQVNGKSMMPNFQNKEFLLTDKLTYQFRDPERGEVVVFRAPPSEPCAEDECEYIKRVIGLPGETIMVKDNHVFINGAPLQEPYLPPNLSIQPGSFIGREPRVVPPDEYALLGDNRPHSRDSREFGFINKERVVGRAFFVYWPPERLGLVKRVVYSFSP